MQSFYSTESNADLVTTDYSDTIQLEGAESISIQVVNTVDTPSAAVCASASAVDATDNIFTKAAHDFTTGLKVQVSTSSALPTGISALTDYFVVVVDTDTFQLSDTLAHALAGTDIIDISDVGTGNQTFTPVALAGGAIKAQYSNDGSNWHDYAAATNITTTASVMLVDKDRPTYRFMRTHTTLTAGRISQELHVVVKR